MSMRRLVACGQTVTAHRWLRFCLVGGAATLTYALLGLLFVEACRLPLLAGNGLAYVLSFAVSYLGQSRWTFGMPRRSRGEGTRLMAFALAQLCGLGLNSVLIHVLVALHVPYWLAMFMAVVPVAAVVYALCRFGIFRKGVQAKHDGGTRDPVCHGCSRPSRGENDAG